MTWEPPPPPSTGITKEQFVRAMNITARTALTLMEGNGDDLFKSLPDAMGMTWDLTRPGARCIDHDLLPRVRELDPVGAATVKEFTSHTYFSEDGDVMMSFVLGGNTDGSQHAPQHMIDAFSQAADEHLRDIGVDPDGAGITTLYSEFRKATSVTEEKMVEEFKDDLDSIFQTWNGGGDET